ncbi:TATA box binding protein (TBP)-associated factor, RNA polymerase II [Phaffia rhodozyma]|uniref:Transcription initiation factor TFIID subunit 4 n=1 Tax=Phaffia rhodozyma TaxID=264483 RepID=A0A0F7SQJ4_PHARH|nr:TATA box binding protein (TBP)-associated factor, RNA polymerase II [Phaffia rhodozyma]
MNLSLPPNRQAPTPTANSSASTPSVSVSVSPNPSPPPPPLPLPVGDSSTNISLKLNLPSVARSTKSPTSTSTPTSTAPSPDVVLSPSSSLSTSKPSTVSSVPTLSASGLPTASSSIAPLRPASALGPTEGSSSPSLVMDPPPPTPPPLQTGSTNPVGPPRLAQQPVGARKPGPGPTTLHQATTAIRHASMSGPSTGMSSTPTSASTPPLGFRRDSDAGIASTLKTEPDDDAVKGVDIRAEEEATRGYSYQASSRPPAGRRPDEINRNRKQNFLDAVSLRRKMAEIATRSYSLQIEEDALTYLALSIETRVRDLLSSMISAKDHRTTAHASRPPATYPDSTQTPRWTQVVTSDPGRVITALDRTERDEESRRRRERFARDEEEKAEEKRKEDERLMREALGLKEDDPLPGQEPEHDLSGDAEGDRQSSVTGGKDGTGSDHTINDGGSEHVPTNGDEASKTKTKSNKKKRPKSDAPASSDHPSTPSNAGEKPAKRSKRAAGPGVTAKTMSEQTQKRVSNSVALHSAGIARKSWMLGGGAGASLGIITPTPAQRTLKGPIGKSGLAPSTPTASGPSSLSSSTPTASSILVPSAQSSTSLIGTNANPSTSTNNNNTSSTATGGGWSKPFLSAVTSTPLGPNVHDANRPGSGSIGRPTFGGVGLGRRPLNSGANGGALSYGTDEDWRRNGGPVTMRDALFVLGRERGHGAGRGSAGRVLPRALVERKDRGWD